MLGKRVLVARRCSRAHAIRLAATRAGDILHRTIWKLPYLDVCHFWILVRLRVSAQRRTAAEVVMGSSLEALALFSPLEVDDYTLG